MQKGLKYIPWANINKKERETLGVDVKLTLSNNKELMED